MAETAELKAEIRDHTGSKAASRLRGQGKLPAVIYGHGQEPVSIAIDRHDFIEGLHHGQRIFSVQMAQVAETLLLKDLQYDHLGKEVIHADLVRINLNERVVVKVPIELRGTAKGTHEGGIVDESLDHLEIECLASEIPDSIPVTIKELSVGQSIHAKDVPLPGGAVLKTDPEAMLCICHLPKAKVAAEEEAVEAPSEPEVITERAQQEEESSE